MSKRILIDSSDKDEIRVAVTTNGKLDDFEIETSKKNAVKGDVYLAEQKYKQALESYQLAYQLIPATKVLDGILGILTVQNKEKEVIALLEKELAKNKVFV